MNGTAGVLYPCTSSAENLGNRWRLGWHFNYVDIEDWTELMGENTW